MQEEKNTKKTERKKRKYRENNRHYVIPYIEGLSQAFKQIAKKCVFEIAMKPGRKVKDLKTKARYFFGEKNNRRSLQNCTGMFKFENTGKSKRKWARRKKEHQDKVRLTQKDIAENNREHTEKQMNRDDRGLVKYDQT